jgi:perosamine synthetase
MIPVSEPLILSTEIKYVEEALRTGWISSEGRFIKDFEKAFSSYVGRKFGIAVNNGTNALILAVRALDLPVGSEVIMPTFTIISCAIACIYNNLVPVFVDSEKDTWNMDVSAVEEKITPKTRAIMAVHIYGHPTKMDSLIDIVKKYNLSLIEDFAEAIGSECNGSRCGTFGEVSCASFYSNKAITTGEGGMCLTNSVEFFGKLQRLKNLAFLPGERFVHRELGFNFRMTNIQAAIGLAQVERIEDHVNKKMLIGERYGELLRPLEEKGLIQLPVQKAWAKNTYWMYGVVLNEKHGIDAKTFMGRLAERDIQTRPFFYPMHQQPAFERFEWFKRQSLPVSESLCKYGFYLPSGLTLTENNIERVAATVTTLLR